MSPQERKKLFCKRETVRKANEKKQNKKIRGNKQSFVKKEEANKTRKFKQK